MSRAAREWVRDLGEHLAGAPRALLWATADRANNALEFWTSEPTMASESGVSYRHVQRLVPVMVVIGVWDRLKPAAGPRPAVYRFTLLDPAGLSTPDMVSALSEASLPPTFEPLPPTFEHATPDTMSDKPLEPGNHPAKGGCLVPPESDDRERDGLAADAAAAPARADAEPEAGFQEFKDWWRAALVPSPRETDPVEEAAKKRAALERLARRDAEASGVGDEAGQQRKDAS